MKLKVEEKPKPVVTLGEFKTAVLKLQNYLVAEGQRQNKYHEFLISILSFINVSVRDKDNTILRFTNHTFYLLIEVNQMVGAGKVPELQRFISKACHSIDYFEVYTNVHRYMPIVVEGNEKLVKALYGLIKNALDSSSYKKSYPVSGYAIPQIGKFGIDKWSLKKSINGKLVVQIILDFIKENNRQIDKRSNYIMQYWNFEAKKIEANKLLTCQTVLIFLYNRFAEKGILPLITQEKLFDLLENACSLFLPKKDKLETFITERLFKKNHHDIRRAARIIGQGQRYASCLFFKLVPDINQKIAYLTIDHCLYTETSAMEIAAKNFAKPM